MRGYIHQKGTKLLDGNGEQLLLRGVGFGNWLLPEGYMWRFFKKCDRPRRIEQLVRSLLGDAQADAFWDAYYDTYITKEDIEYIKNSGLNSVRIPINARLLMTFENANRKVIPKSIAYIDRLLEWCEELGIYAVLDLHGAPGGQTGTNIDDSENDYPKLFTDETYREDTIWLWRELAARYKDNKMIAGYDLLNEPLPNWFAEHNDKVLPLYRDITDAIREVDQNHMVILEGVHWATDFSIFHPLKDNPIDNCMLQFHKYWNNPDTESLQEYLEYQELLQVPLYMGEGGENNLAWYSGVFHLLEQHNIGWNFWTYKKLDTHNSPVSIPAVEGWESLIEYINGGECPQNPQGIFSSFLHNIQYANCTINNDVLRHVTRTAPLRIRAVYYDIHGYTAHTKREGIEFRRSDMTDIRYVIGKNGELSFKHYGGEDPDVKNRLCLAISKGERFLYTFSAACEDIVICCRSKTNGCIQASINNEQLGSKTVLKDTMHTVHLGRAATGDNKLEIAVTSGEVEIEWILVG